MKRLVGEMNSVVGSHVLFYTLAAFPFYATDFVLLFDSENWIIRLRTCYYIILYLTSLSIAAEAHHKVRDLSGIDGQPAALALSICP